MTSLNATKELIIIFCLLLLNVTIVAQNTEKFELTLDHIFSDSLSAKSFGPVKWFYDGTAFTTLEASVDGPGQEIVKYDSYTGNKEVLVPSWRLIPPGKNHPIQIDDYQWCQLGNRILIYTDKKDLVRDGSTGNYWVLDLSLWSWWKLGGDAPLQSLRDARLSPDGEKVSYIIDSELFVEDISSFTMTQLTNDGSTKVFNGRAKGVNQSMVNLRYSQLMNGREGFTWSPDSRRIAYIQIDNTQVPDFYIINNIESLYPKVESFPYVKAGQTMATFKIGIIDSRGGETVWVNLPDNIDPENYFVWQMHWPEHSDELVLQLVNRGQDTLEVIFVDPVTGKTERILTEADDKWIEPNNIYWIENGEKFIFMSERSGWVHAYLYSRSGRMIQPLTSGAYDVVAIKAVDEKNGILYIVASPDNPAERHLYTVNLKNPANPVRLSQQDQAGTYRYDFSPTSNVAILNYSAFGVPPKFSLVKLPDHQIIETFEDNEALTKILDRIDKSDVEFFSVDIGDGIELPAYGIKPPDFDPAKKYPLFYYIYGEPALQTVLDLWDGNRYLWHLMLAQKGYFVVSMDNRGTASLKGRSWRKAIHRKLGIQAAIDHAEGTRRLIAERPYIDGDKVGIYGHSGGGQMSLNLIFRYPDIYKLAMPSSFVSHQRYYHPGYQERFMDHPRSNPDGYRDGSPITWAHNLQGDLLLIYGSGDTNTHYQSLEAMVNELVAHKKQFSLMVYPNRGHALSEGKNTQHHLFELRTNFLLERMPPNE